MQQAESREPELVAATVRGSTAALGELFRLHSEAVYRLAFRLTGSPDDASDVLQDVFVGLPRALRSYQEMGKFAAWLKRLTARTALMRLRAGSRRSEHELNETDATTGANPVLERIALETALRTMPDTLRVTFVLKEIEGYSHDEVADLLGITSAASAARLSRSWKHLRKAVGQV